MRRLPAMLSSFLMIAAVVACASSGATSGGAAPSGAAKTSSPKVRTNPDLITKAEIDAGGFRDAYDVVQRLRPTWFTKAKSSSAQSMGGIQVSGGNSGVQSSSTGAGLLVYLDNTRMGGTDALRDIPATSITALQYMDAATATARLPGIGSTVISGAIVATSRTGQ